MESKNEEKIGDRIFKLLQTTNYTQKELAHMVGVTEAAMSRYLRNEREPRMEVIANLATVFNTTTDYLITGRDEECDYSEMKVYVARSRKSLSSDEKIKLVKLLMEND